MDIPVTVDEIIQASKSLKNSAPGLDGMKEVDLNKIAPEDMATHMTHLHRHEQSIWFGFPSIDF